MESRVCFEHCVFHFSKSKVQNPSHSTQQMPCLTYQKSEKVPIVQKIKWHCEWTVILLLYNWQSNLKWKYLLKLTPLLKGHLYAHIQRVHSEKYNSMGRDYVDSITCSSCDKPFSSGNLYLSHYQLKHGGFPPEYNDKEKFFCDQCPKIFLEKHRLASHKRSGVILIVEL